MSEQPSATITGGCLCGAIRYRLTAAPQFCLYCYCRDCQQSTGSDRFAGAMFAETDFELTEGQPSVFNTQGVSGRRVGRHFCSECSSMLWGQTEMGLVSVCAGTLDDTSVFQPTMAVFTEAAPEHAAVPQDLITTTD